MHKLFSRRLGKINEFCHCLHYHADRSGGLLPPRRGKPEGNTPPLCINSLNYVWYVLVHYTNTSWSSVCHKYFPIQTSARICSISVILRAISVKQGWQAAEKFKNSRHISAMYVHNMSELLPHWSQKSTKDHTSPQLFHICQNNDTKLRFFSSLRRKTSSACFSERLDTGPESTLCTLFPLYFRKGDMVAGEVWGSLETPQQKTRRTGRWEQAALLPRTWWGMGAEADRCAWGQGTLWERDGELISGKEAKGPWLI